MSVEKNAEYKNTVGKVQSTKFPYCAQESKIFIQRDRTHSRLASHRVYHVILRQ